MRKGKRENKDHENGGTIERRKEIKTPALRNTVNNRKKRIMRNRNEERDEIMERKERKRTKEKGKYYKNVNLVVLRRTGQ